MSARKAVKTRRSSKASSKKSTKTSSRKSKKREGPYELYYWPGIQGRGEFVRLALEAAGAPYVDVARLPGEQGGTQPLIAMLGRGAYGTLPFAPPILKHGGLLIAQTALILHYLGPRLGLVPRDEAGRVFAHQLQLTITDFISEAHDTHHPIGVDLYYEDQKPEALRRSGVFIANRIPKYLGYFERVLDQNRASRGRHAVGEKLSYVDLSLFQVMSGLGFAFPRALAAAAPRFPRLVALRDQVAALPRVAAYLASPRRIAFNQHGLFRYYAELDG